jgi:hypothetical protein
MTEIMVERVARALCINDRCDPELTAPEGGWRLWEDAARAAIEAMREPTEAMMAAVNDHYRERVGLCYGVMIDAALSPEKETV